MRSLLFAALGLVVGCGSDTFVPAGAEGGADATTGDGGCEDVHFCDDKCGTGLADACGQKRDCRVDCGTNAYCDGNTHTCICKQLPGWCAGRCGNTVDNCGVQVNCGTCEAGMCSASSTCGDCTVTSNDCNGKQCGAGTNNCGQAVICGVCPGVQICTNGKCCDDQTVACAGKCGTVTNNCGQQFNCGTMCPLGWKCCNNVCDNVATDYANCGACGASCKPITNSNVCENGGCTCAGHSNNTDPNACGPCSGNVSMNCKQANRTQCVSGVCFP